MEARDTKGKIVKETFPSEMVSIVGDIFAGIVLSILIVSFESFLILILIIPALLSLRGNLSGPFIARTSRDLIIGEFNLKSWFENILATYALALITAIAIGLLSITLYFSYWFINCYTYNFYSFDIISFNSLFHCLKFLRV
jgi:cation transporter-like permease